MAVDLNFTIYGTNGCTELRFNDSTCSYSIVNTGGWGSPNELLSSVTDWSISIYPPDSSTYLPSLNLVTFSNPSGLPSEDCDSISLSLDTLYGTGSTSVIDGIYEISYAVTTNTTSYIKVKRIAVYCSVECCIHRMALKLKEGCCCDNEFVKNYILAETLLDALKVNAECGNETKFISLLKKLQKICSFQSCGC